MRIPPVAVMILASTMAFAASTAAAAETLQPGLVACISSKAAIQYAEYAKTAPDFARDMLDRATCYVNKDAAEVVKTGQVGGYTQYKLLSGHKVWVPANAAAAPKGK